MRSSSIYVVSPQVSTWRNHVALLESRRCAVGPFNSVSLRISSSLLKTRAMKLLRIFLVSQKFRTSQEWKVLPPRRRGSTCCWARSTTPLLANTGQPQRCSLSCPNLSRGSLLKNFLRIARHGAAGASFAPRSFLSQAQKRRTLLSVLPVLFTGFSLIYWRLSRLVQKARSIF